MEDGEVVNLTSPKLERYTHDALAKPLGKSQRTLFHSSNDRLGEESCNAVIRTESKFLHPCGTRSQHTRQAQREL